MVAATYSRIHHITIGLNIFHPRTKITLNTLVGTTYSRIHHTTIGLELFHFRVRNGIGWDKLSIIPTRIFNINL